MTLVDERIHEYRFLHNKHKVLLQLIHRLDDDEDCGICVVYLKEQEEATRLRLIELRDWLKEVISMRDLHDDL